MNDWIEWHGGGCPIPDAKAGGYEVHYRYGDEIILTHDPAKYKWDHDPDFDRYDIIAYRLIEPEQQSDLDWMEIDLIDILENDDHSLYVSGDRTLNAFLRGRISATKEILSLIKTRKEGKA